MAITATAEPMSDAFERTHDISRISFYDPAAFELLHTVHRRKSRVFIVEDHIFVRQGMVSLLNRQTDLVCWGEAGTMAAAADLIPDAEPDLVLLDLQLRDGDGLEMMDFLREECDNPLVLVLSQSTELATVERALKLGANGYLSKHAGSDELLKAIRTVLLGGLYVTHDLAVGMLCKLLNR